MHERSRRSPVLSHERACSSVAGAQQRPGLETPYRREPADGDRIAMTGAAISAQSPTGGPDLRRTAPRRPRGRRTSKVAELLEADEVLADLEDAVADAPTIFIPAGRTRASAAMRGRPSPSRCAADPPTGSARIRRAADHPRPLPDQCGRAGQDFGHADLVRHRVVLVARVELAVGAENSQRPPRSASELAEARPMDCSSTRRSPVLVRTEPCGPPILAGCLHVPVVGPESTARTLLLHRRMAA